AAVGNYYEEPHEGNDVEEENAEGSFQGTQVPAPHGTASGSTQKKKYVGRNISLSSFINLLKSSIPNDQKYSTPSSHYATLRDYDKEQSDEEEEEEVRENLFAGGEKSLGSDEEPSVEVNSQPSTTEPPRTDGPLMAYDDPANEEFLKAINNGYL
ncbi:1899_t:CDS:2, partial [Racocetra fulgida]